MATIDGMDESVVRFLYDNLHILVNWDAKDTVHVTLYLGNDIISESVADQKAAKNEKKWEHWMK